MSLPHPPQIIHNSAFRNSQTYQPSHERPTQRWQQLPVPTRDVMQRTLGRRVLAPLPLNEALQFARRTPDRVHAQAGSETVTMPPQPAQQPSHLAAPISSYPTPLGFVALLSAYRPTGGTVRGDDLSRHVLSEEPGHLTNLARKLVSGSILSFPWRQTLWVPLFQFSPGSSTVRAPVNRVMDELSDAFDSWEIAVWFVQPNTWLRGQRPLDMLDRPDADVVQAARTDRFVAIG